VAEVKTKPSARSVERFLNGTADARTRKDCSTLVEIAPAGAPAPPNIEFSQKPCAHRSCVRLQAHGGRRRATVAH